LNKIDKDGIIYREWKLPSPQAVFLLVHGLGAHSGRWEFLADFFLKNNVSSYAIELKGFGETKDLKGHVDSFKTYFDDIHSLYSLIKKENPDRKIFILGESLGALISFLFVISRPDLFSGIVCISPAFKSRLKFSIPEYSKIFFYLVFNPKRQFSMPFDSSMCTQDLLYQKVMDEDAREHRYATSKLLFNTLIGQIQAKILKNKVAIPTLFLVAGEEDELVDTRESKAIFNGLKVKDKKIIQYPNMRHALSIELEREVVFRDIFNWIQLIATHNR
jgi:acylglycerol lipase